MKPREAAGAHDPTYLPPDIPVPQDDGAARHLTGMTLPDIALAATSGPEVNLSKLKGRDCRLHLSAHRRARPSMRRRAGTISPVHAAARRNPAAFAIISPN